MKLPRHASMQLSSRCRVRRGGLRPRRRRAGAGGALSQLRFCEEIVEQPHAGRGEHVLDGDSVRRVRRQRDGARGEGDARRLLAHVERAGDLGGRDVWAGGGAEAVRVMEEEEKVEVEVEEKVEVEVEEKVEVEVIGKDIYYRQGGGGGGLPGHRAWLSSGA